MEKDELMTTQEEVIEEYNDYPCSTNYDYSPANPWDAPGMDISDFI